MPAEESGAARRVSIRRRPRRSRRPGHGLGSSNARRWLELVRLPVRKARVRRRPTIGEDPVHWQVRVRAERLDEVGALGGDGIEPGRADGRAWSAGRTENRRLASGSVQRPQTGEGEDEHDAAVSAATRQIAGLGGLLEDAETVPRPLRRTRRRTHPRASKARQSSARWSTNRPERARRWPVLRSKKHPVPWVIFEEPAPSTDRTARPAGAGTPRIGTDSPPIVRLEVAGTARRRQHRAVGRTDRACRRGSPDARCRAWSRGLVGSVASRRPR